MLDSVVTMNICIADIKEISLCTNEKSPVLFVKTSTAISDTLKKNMSNRSADVFFDPTSKGESCLDLNLRLKSKSEHCFSST